nr:Golgi membrane protein 1 [Vicugna pacos]
MMGLGNGRRSMKSPPLLLAALVACVIVLGFNYWIASSRSVDLQTRILELEGRVRRAAAERGAVEMKKNEFQGELEKQREQLDKIQSSHNFQMESVNKLYQDEKAVLVNNITTGERLIRTLQDQLKALQKNYGKLQQEVLQFQKNQSNLERKFSYDLNQCINQMKEVKEQCDERIEEVTKKGNAAGASRAPSEQKDQSQQPRAASEPQPRPQEAGPPRGRETAPSKGEPQTPAQFRGCAQAGWGPGFIRGVGGSVGPRGGGRAPGSVLGSELVSHRRDGQTPSAGPPPPLVPPHCDPEPQLNSLPGGHSSLCFVHRGSPGDAGRQQGGAFEGRPGAAAGAGPRAGCGPGRPRGRKRRRGGQTPRVPDALFVSQEDPEEEGPEREQLVIRDGQEEEQEPGAEGRKQQKLGSDDEYNMDENEAESETDKQAALVGNDKNRNVLNAENQKGDSINLLDQPEKRNQTL